MINEKKADPLAAADLETSDLNNVPRINRITRAVGVSGFAPNGRNAVKCVAWEGGDEEGAAGHMIPFVSGVTATEFDQPEEPPPVDSLKEFMTPVDRRRWEMISFSIRKIEGSEKRSFAEGAAALGCSGVALFKAHRTTLGRLRLLAIYDEALSVASERKEANAA